MIFTLSSTEIVQYSLVLASDTEFNIFNIIVIHDSSIFVLGFLLEHFTRLEIIIPFSDSAIYIFFLFR